MNPFPSFGPRRRELCALALGSPVLLGATLQRVGGLRDVSVESFRKQGMSDREVLQHAFEAWDQGAGGNFVFGPGRTYDLGALQRDAPPFVLDHAVGVSVVGNGARLMCNTVAGIAPVFLIRRSRGVSITDLRLEDRGYTPHVNWRGAVLVYLEGSAGPSTDLALARLRADGAVSLCICSGLNSEGRVSRVTLSQLTARNCYYGVAFEENGDEVRCSMTADNCRRAYFCYGVKEHRVDLSISGDGSGVGSDGCVVVARYARDTSGIAITARFSGKLAWKNLVHLVQFPPPGTVGTVSDVAVALDVDPRAVDRANGADATFTVYDKSGGRPVPTSPSIWRNVRTTGRGIGGRRVVARFETRPT